MNGSTPSMPAAAARVRAVSSVERAHWALNLCGVVLNGTLRRCQRTNRTIYIDDSKVAAAAVRTSGFSADAQTLRRCRRRWNRLRSANAARTKQYAQSMWRR